MKVCVGGSNCIFLLSLILALGALAHSHASLANANHENSSSEEIARKSTDRDRDNRSRDRDQNPPIQSAENLKRRETLESSNTTAPEVDSLESAEATYSPNSMDATAAGLPDFRDESHRSTSNKDFTPISRFIPGSDLFFANEKRVSCRPNTMALDKWGATIWSDKVLKFSMEGDRPVYASGTFALAVRRRGDGIKRPELVQSVFGEYQGDEIEWDGREVLSVTLQPKRSSKHWGEIKLDFIQLNKSYVVVDGERYQSNCVSPIETLLSKPGVFSGEFEKNLRYRLFPGDETYQCEMTVGSPRSDRSQTVSYKFWERGKSDAEPLKESSLELVRNHLGEIFWKKTFHNGEERLVPPAVMVSSLGEVVRSSNAEPIKARIQGYRRSNPDEDESIREATLEFRASWSLRGFGFFYGYDSLTCPVLKAEFFDPKV